MKKRILIEFGVLSLLIMVLLPMMYTLFFVSGKEDMIYFFRLHIRYVVPSLLVLWVVFRLWRIKRAGKTATS